MSRKCNLMQTNRYLGNPDRYLRMLLVNVASSTAVETGGSIRKIVRRLEKEKGQ